MWVGYSSGVLLFISRQVHKLREWEGFRNFKDISLLAKSSKWGIVVLSASLLPDSVAHLKSCLMSEAAAERMLDVTASMPRPDRLLVFFPKPITPITPRLIQIAPRDFFSSSCTSGRHPNCTWSSRGSCCAAVRLGFRMTTL